MAANATAVWRVRPSGNNNNGGGYDSGIAGAGTDFSQQNAAQVTQSGGTVSTATVTLTDTGAAFTTSLIGNGIRVAGTGISTTYTFITARPSATTLTLQTSPGTTGTTVTYSIGGGWADFWTNTTSSGPLVAGNVVNILGSGIPNPASYVNDYNYNQNGVTPVAGTAALAVIFANDPATPSYKAYPDTTGGMPCVQMSTSTGLWFQNNIIQGIWFVASGMTAGSSMFQRGGGTISSFVGCVIDQFGIDTSLIADNGYSMFGCEVYSSVSAAAGTHFGYSNGGGILDSCNFHDLIGVAINITFPTTVRNCIVAKNGADGIVVNNTTVNFLNNTIDGNGGNGIKIVAFNAGGIIILSNIITNHVAGGTFGINNPSAVNASCSVIDYQSFYNNTANYATGANAPHDTVLGASPYVASTTENYTLA